MTSKKVKPALRGKGAKASSLPKPDKGASAPVKSPEVEAKTETDVTVEQIINGRGRPVGVDMKDKKTAQQVYIFGRLVATYGEMADFFDIDIRTIERYMAEEEGDFCRVYKKGKSEAKVSLRRQQIAKAQSGNTLMQIWLGKQLLGQRDKMLVGEDDENPLPVVSGIEFQGVAPSDHQPDDEEEEPTPPDDAGTPPKESQ